MKSTRRSAAVITTIAATAAALLAASGVVATAANASTTFIGSLHHTKVIASTVPANGDVNPYGVAVIPRSTGDLHRGDVLVSNFNDKANVQGTGTTIVQVSPHGQGDAVRPGRRQGVPRRGRPHHRPRDVAQRLGDRRLAAHQERRHLRPWLPDRPRPVGARAQTIAGHGIDGPWDMTALDQGDITELFVTNVLGGILGRHNPNGGTVQRLVITSSPFRTPHVLASTTIGSGFPAKTDPNALVIGPTGVGLGFNGTLYVADTLSSRIAAIPDAVFRHSMTARAPPCRRAAR